MCFRVCLQMLMGLLLLASTVTCVAAPWQGDGEPSLTLQAPETVQGLLKSYFDLPTQPLLDEMAQEAFMRRARREIAELLATEGYFAPQLTLLTVEQGYVLQVTTGPQAKVAQLNLIFKGDIAAQEASRQARVDSLREFWALKPGSVFRSADWDRAKLELQAKVAEKYYALAQIAYSQADVNPANHEVNLTLVLDSGPAFLFGDVLVSGLSRYQTSLVDRIRPFNLSDPYQRDKLLTLQTRLQSMPQFASVRVNTEPDATAYEEGSEFEGVPPFLPLPVHVVVSEMKPRRLAFGLGYSSNNGARSELNFQDYHFMGRMWKMMGDLSLEQNRQSLTANVETLSDERGYVLSWGGVSEATLIEDLTTRRHKLSFARSRNRASIDRRLSLSWQQETQIPLAGVESITQALVLDWKWHRRAVDNPLNPRDGTSTELRLGGASRAALSDQNFFRTYWRQQFWLPVRDDVLSLRSEFAYTAAPNRQGIPQEYLFRAGGTQSLRGYDYLSLGVTEGDSVVGGRVMATASAEYTHWFNAKWGGAVFMDVGDAADRMGDLRWATGYGVGARWLSPVGPLALDVAQGNRSPSWKLHFSIAVAF